MRSFPKKLLEALNQQGKAIYESKLKSLVEPAFNGQFIAIHVDSEDYAVGKSTAKAARALLKTHPPDGRLYLRRIGSEPEYGLAARLLTGEQATGRPK
jgi:hypothetical protein